MSDTPDIQELTPAQQRLVAAQQALDEEVQGAEVLGIVGVQVPSYTDAVAGMNALVTLLVAKGLVDEAEFREAKATDYAEQLEGFTSQLQDLKQKVTSKLLLAQVQHPPDLI